MAGGIDQSTRSGTHQAVITPETDTEPAPAEPVATAPAVAAPAAEPAPAETSGGLSFDFTEPVRSIPGVRQSLPHIKALDGLRGIAVIGVVLYHLDMPWMTGGFLGVSLFFTLSGFLITSLLLAEEARTSSIDFTSFWVRRYRRLLPAAWAGIALAVVATAAGGEADQLRRLPGDVGAALVQFANVRFIVASDAYTSAYQTPSPLLHYWSLSIEEQFYLLLPLLVAVMVRAHASRRAWGVVVTVLLAGSAVATTLLYDPFNTGRVYFNSITRVGEILAGVALAVALGRWWKRPVAERTGHWLAGNGIRPRLVRHGAPAVALGLTIAMWVFVRTDDQWLYQGGLFGVAAVSCVLLAGVLHRGPTTWLLSTWPLRWVGLISYGVYVYHWPLFQWVNTDHTGLVDAQLVAARLAATLALSVVSYFLLERPVRRGEIGFRLATGALSMAFVTIVVSLSVWLSGTASRRAVADADAALRSSYVVTRPPITSPTAAPPPGAPEVNPPQRVLLLGDSLLHQSLDLISVEMEDQGTQIKAIGGPSQTLLRNQAAWMSELSDALKSFRPDVVVLESCCGHYDPRDPYIENGVALDIDSERLWQVWERRVEEAIRLSRGHSAAVVWALAPPARTNGFYGPIEDRITRANGIVMAMSRKYPDLTVLDWGVLTGPNGEYQAFLPDSNGRLVLVRAADGFHFADAGKKVLAEVTRTSINDAWKAAKARENIRSAPQR